MATTLSEIKTRCRQAVDSENDSSISDSELTNYINASLADLYEIVLSAYTNDYFTVYSGITTVSGTSDYPLDESIYKVIGVDLNDGGTNWTLQKFSYQERNKYQGTTLNPAYGTSFYRYRDSAGFIKLTPTPTATHNLTVWFTPKLEKLTEDTDEVSSNFLDIWVEYVVMDVSVKILMKRQDLGDVQFQISRRNELRSRIEEQLASNEFGLNDTILDSNSWEIP